jgi:hypothetical protein
MSETSLQWLHFQLLMRTRLILIPQPLILVSQWIVISLLHQILLNNEMAHSGWRGDSHQELTVSTDLVDISAELLTCSIVPIEAEPNFSEPNKTFQLTDRLTPDIGIQDRRTISSSNSRRNVVFMLTVSSSPISPSREDRFF